MLEPLFLLWAFAAVVIMLFCLVMILFVKIMAEEKEPVRSYIVEDDEYDDWKAIEDSLVLSPPWDLKYPEKNR